MKILRPLCWIGSKYFIGRAHNWKQLRFINTATQGYLPQNIKVSYDSLFLVFSMALIGCVVEWESKGTQFQNASPS